MNILGYKLNKDALKRIRITVIEASTGYLMTWIINLLTGISNGEVVDFSDAYVLKNLAFTLTAGLIGAVISAVYNAEKDAINGEIEENERESESATHKNGEG